MRGIHLILYSFAGGMTLSGIVANLYRIMARKPKSRTATAIHYGVMTVAGPSVLFENATRSFRARDCSRAAYAFAVAIAGYWAVLIGALIFELAL